MATQVAVPNPRVWNPMPFPLIPLSGWPGGPAAPGPAAEKNRVRAEEPWPHRRPRGEGERLVVALLPLVKRLALHIRERLPLHVEVDDLIGSGVLGLVDAVAKFDGCRKVKLAQYARHRIRGAIFDGLRAEDTASRDMRKKNKKAEQVYQRLEMQLGRAPSDAEMAKGLGISLARWYRTVRELQPAGLAWLRPSASVGVKEAQTNDVESLPAGPAGGQFEACYRREQQEIVGRALERIPERERQVVHLYYRQELTMREIGERLGIDESRVSQLHSAAVVHLRKRVKDFLQHPAPAAPRLAW